MTYPPPQQGPPQQPWPGPPQGPPPQGPPPQWQGYPGQQYPGQGMPPKKNNGLLIGLLAGGGALLLVIVFVITAFVAPGFLVPKHHAPAAPPPPPLDPTSATVTVNKFILEVYGSNPYKAADSACDAERQDAIDIAIRLIDEHAQLNSGTPFESGTEAFSVPVTGTAGSSSIHGEMSVTRQSNQTYCISDITGLT